MPLPLTSLTLRARLILLGALAGGALLILAVITVLLMTGIRSQTTSSSAKLAQGQTLSQAYESWITNDDQNNMYVALLALREPSTQRLAQSTWSAAVAAYEDAHRQLAKLQGELRNSGELALLASTESALTSYNSFSLRVRQAAQAGDVAQAVRIQAVGNAAVSSALVTRFTNLRTAFDRTAAGAAANVKSSAGSGITIVLIIVAIMLPLLAMFVFLAVRSILSGVRHVAERVVSLAEAMDNQIKGGLSALARGDFTVHLSAQTATAKVTRADELGDIMRKTEGMRDTILECYEHYNESIEKLRETIRQISDTALSVDGTSKEMATSSEESGKATGEIAEAIEHVAQGAERQVSIIETARRAAEEVAAAVTESAEQAEQAAEVAGRARETARQGVAAAEQADTAMRSVRDSSANVTDAIRELAQKSEQIGEIVRTITGIAEQTNLLALNAAIEAARAGEQGRGFAVVAEEVRKLAEESEQAAAQISGLIGAIQTETAAAVGVVEDGAQTTADGASVVEQARNAFVSLGEAVEDMSGRVEQIAAAAEQISASATMMRENILEAAAVAEESSAATQEVSASTEQTSAASEEVAAGAAEMAGNADTLRALVSGFQLGSSTTGSERSR